LKLLRRLRAIAPMVPMLTRIAGIRNFFVLSRCMNFSRFEGCLMVSPVTNALAVCTRSIIVVFMVKVTSLLGDLIKNCKRASREFLLYLLFIFCLPEL
jgi:hypothetical protein